MRLAIPLLILALLGVGDDADAQRRKRRRSRKPPAAAPAPAPAPAEAPAPPATAGGKPVVTSGKKGKDQSFDFTGIELAGSMRMPQLLYFLDRAEEELQRASLERRSFVPEMVRSIDEESL
jgi:hypothetical protein